MDWKNLIKLYFIFLLLCTISKVSAQPGRGLNRNELTSSYNRLSVETIRGRISSIDTVKIGYGRFPGILLSLKTEKQVSKIYVAPVWYLKNQKLKFTQGDLLTITGSQIEYRNSPLMIAKEFSYNEKKIIIRNESGIPVWAGKRNGPGQGRRVGR